MLVKYDPADRSATLGIRQLIGFGLLPEHLLPPSYIDLADRNRIHGEFQQRAAAAREGVRREVPVSWRVDRGGYSFLIRGRIDLLEETPGGQRVIEVKTVSHLPSAADPAAAYPDYALQLAFYLLALRGADGGPPPAGALVFIDIASGAVADVPFPGERGLAFWEAALLARLDDAAAYLDRELAWRGRQLAALETFLFAYPERRPGQDRIAELVRYAIDNKEHYFLQAPTGIGKTAAVLSGALPAAARDNLLLFYLTAKGTQKRIVIETLERIAAAGLPVRAVFLTAKEKICLREDGLCCQLEDCPYARDYAAKVRGHRLIDRLLAAGIMTGETIAAAGQEAGVCPHELSLDLAEHADLIVGDYNYVFDPRVFLRRIFQTGHARRVVLLIDEAANLIERARGYYSPEIKETMWRAVRELETRHRKLLRPLLTPLRQTFREWAKTLRGNPAGAVELPADAELPSDGPAWQAAWAALPAPVPRAWTDLALAVRAFLMVQQQRDARFHLVFRRGGDGLAVQWFCADPAAFLRERIKQCRCAIAFSATLTPFPHYQRLLGFDPELTAAEELPYPFPQENVAVWIDPRVDTTFRARERFLPALGQRIAAIHRQAPGTYLVFFPSYQYLRQAQLVLETLGLPVAAQSPGMDDPSRERFLRDIAREDHLVLTVAGGIFAEGVDLRAPRLRGAIIAGPCLPTVELTRGLLANRFQEVFGDGFLHAYVIPGIQRIVQAAGRLIRFPSDRGAIILFDRRFLSQPYAGLLPSHWRPSGQVPVLSGDAWELREFWPEQAADPVPGGTAAGGLDGPPAE